MVGLFVCSGVRPNCGCWMRGWDVDGVVEDGGWNETYGVWGGGRGCGEGGLIDCALWEGYGAKGDNEKCIGKSEMLDRK